MRGLLIRNFLTTPQMRELLPLSLLNMAIQQELRVLIPDYVFFRTDLLANNLIHAKMCQNLPPIMLLRTELPELLYMWTPIHPLLKMTSSNIPEPTTLE